MMVVFIIIVIHTNAFLKDNFNTLLTDTPVEMNRFRRDTWGRRSELLHATEMLIISVFAPLFYQRLVCQITKVLHDEHTTHQTDWLVVTAVVLTIQSLKSCLKFSPVYFVGQLVKRV